MIAISSLWLAILLAALCVFLASVLVWMVLPHHTSDFRPLPDEASTASALRAQQLAPGMYAFPQVADRGRLAEPAVADRFRKGPVGFVTILPNGVPALSRRLLQALGYHVLVAAMVAFVLTRSLRPGAGFQTVFRVAATVAWMTHSFGAVQDAIWLGKPRAHVWKGLADGLLYGLLTGWVFAWQWPD